MLAALAFGAGTAQAQTPKKGGTLTFAISAETPNYDCHGSDTFACLHLRGPVLLDPPSLQSLQVPETRGRSRNLLDSRARSDDLHVQAYPNVKFHDGTPLTSADVKASYDRLRNPPDGVVSTRRRRSRISARSTTPDPLTVVFKMKAVNASMIEHFASPWNFIYSAKISPPIQTDRRPRSTAPVRSSSSSTSRAATLPASATTIISRKGCPNLDGFKGVFTLQPAAMLNGHPRRAGAGGVRGISPAERDRLVSAMGDKIRIEESSWTLNLLVVFQCREEAVRRCPASARRC